MYDVAIVGAGPSGLTACVYAARKQLQVILITMDIGGQTIMSADVENYPGFSYITGAELAEKFHQQAANFPLTIRSGALVKTLERAADRFRLVTTDQEVVETRTVIVSTGKQPRKLGVPGEEGLIGRGVSYCAICDAPLFRGRSVIVAGAGNSGVEAALDLARMARDVTVVEIAEHSKADEILLQQAKVVDNLSWLYGTRIVELHGENNLEKVTLEEVATGERTERAAEGVFIEIGMIPTTRWLQGFLKLNKWDEIVVDCIGQTSEPGVFAAGDVTDGPYKQIIIAAGDGAKAALSAYYYLLQRGLAEHTSEW
jgi:NADH-dependent peroxiredoxin subunit F